ncbi:MAG: serine hydrolase [Chloroflexota bacterium]
MLSACFETADGHPQSGTTPTAIAAASILPTEAPDPVVIEGSASPVSTATRPAPLGSPTPIPTITPTPTFPFELSPACGQQMPLRLPEAESAELNWGATFMDDELVPEDAKPAIEYLFENPEDVSLVVYRVGYEGVGFYHNAEQPMPLASISKVIHLAAYANAVDQGELDPNQPVPLEALEAFYLPRSDLGAHNSALRELGRDEITYDDLAWMMIRHSANSSTDYFHRLFGQQVIEQTAQEIGLINHTAPCTYLGRFLVMSLSSSATLSEYALDIETFGQQAALVTDLYLNDPSFQDTAQRSWQRGGQPSLSRQTSFTNSFETQGTALEYANLFARIVRGEMGSPTANAIMQKHLEWPYAEFESNRINYQEIGYKNGRLPGVLTTVYYAWPVWSDRPVVLALFYKDMPTATYQSWRRSFPHDALAHWLMSNPNAIHIMHVLRDNAQAN